MSRSLLLVVSVVVFSLFAETRIKGDLTGMNLDESGNPFIVEQDIIVPDGQKVVIKEGCVFLFNPFTGLQVLGELQVKGTQENPVVFTSIYDNQYNAESPQLPNPFDWNGLLVTREAGSITLANFHLQYSVYGIKSQNPGIKVENGIFKQNGQFHFTIMDKIQFVQDNISYSFNQQELDPNTNDVIKDTGKNSNPEGKKDPSRGVKILRYSSLGVAAVGLITGAVFGAQVPGAFNDVEKAEDEVRAHNFTNTQYEEIRNTFHKKVIGASVGAGALILGGVGFGISFPLGK
ncbi:MAG: hypothetical protein JW915_23340 [Chitinispirillaceae bacterium]|nr:hypothetical protein [Chitinispirillaceae bacterium]